MPPPKKPRSRCNGAGKYVLKLTASDGKQNAEAAVTIIVEPFQAKVTRSVQRD